MEKDAGSDAAMRQEIERLKWRISTLETAELECVRAVHALHESEARYRRLLDEAGFPITIHAADDSTMLFANPLACDFFDLDAPRPPGRRMAEFFPDPSALTDLVALLGTVGVVRDWEAVVKDGKGSAKVLIITASLIDYEGRRAVLATANDITERRHSEALFRSLVEASPDGFGIVGLDGRLTYVSAPVLRFFGYARAEEMLGRDVLDFVAPGEHPRVRERLKAIVQGVYQGPSEWTGVRKDGSTFPQEINGEVLREPDGSPSSLFFIVRDLSNRKRVERSMRWAEKLESLGLMAAGIAHELNNAFQVTRGHLEVAQHEFPLAPPLRDVLAKVGGGVDRATVLAREMLEYSGRSLRVEAPFHLGQIAEEGLAVWRDCLPSQVELVLEEGELPLLRGDDGQVRKVLSALVLNGVEAMEGRRGQVVISTGLATLSKEALAEGFWPAPGREETFVCLAVRDHGDGIPAGALDKVCDPFFTTKGQGRGLGLSAALGILRAHSACLQFVTAPGAGTLARAFFPLAVAPQAAPPPLPAPGAVPPGILIAEDDDTFRDLLVAKIRKWGFTPVLEARNGAEALERFRAHGNVIGLLLTDATMPGMTGPEAFEAMRRIDPALTGLLMTGYSEAFGKATAAGFGFTAFLNKPFSFQDLKAKLAALRPGVFAGP